MPKLSGASHLSDMMRVQGSAAFAVGNICLRIALAYIPLPHWRWVRLSGRCPDSRLQGAGKCRADASERGADDAGQGLHTGCSAEGYDSNDQGVFNQVLAFIVAKKVMDLHKQREH